jgi:hypothetical protein
VAEDIPPDALRAAVHALAAHPWPEDGTTEERIATIVLEAAMPAIERDIRRKMEDEDRGH